MRSSTEVYYTIILASIFFVLLVTIIVASTVRYYARRRAHEMAVQQFEQTLLQTRLEIQEQTFTAISREMHDNICQMLSLAKLNLNTLKPQTADMAQQQVEESTSLISQSLQALRDLAKSLQGGTIQQIGLLAALEQEMRRIERMGIIQTVFRVFGEPINIDENKSVIIFRIAQEAIQNVLKHAEATILEMQIRFSSTSMELMIKDNGKGLPAAGNTDGSGLRNMKDRARIIGADLNLQAADTGGTTVILTLPI
jgi:two-component system NarL family sensor kinase